jgi:hypothetical protein
MTTGLVQIRTPLQCDVVGGAKEGRSGGADEDVTNYALPYVTGIICIGAALRLITSALN